MNKLLVIAVLIFSLLTSSKLFCQPLRDAYRIERIRDSYISGYDSGNTYSNFYYPIPGASVIDSVQISHEHIAGGIPTQINYTKHYTYSDTYYPDRIVMNYDMVVHNEYGTVEHYILITDLEGKTLEISKTHQGNELYHYYFHYNSEGKTDSLSMVYYNFTNHYTMSYDSYGRLAQSIFYQTTDISATHPYRRLTFTYASNAHHYAEPLNLTSFDLHLPEKTLADLVPCLDMNYLPSDIYCEKRENNTWVDSSPDQVYAVYFNYNTVEFHDIRNGTYYIHNTYIFNEQGLLVRESSSNSASVSMTFYSWSQPLNNDDEIALPALFTTYPNPFKDKLNINVQQTKSPADISIYNLKGQLIRSWKDVRTDGLTWDGKDSKNQSVSSGIYIVKARQGKDSSSLKVIKY